MKKLKYNRIVVLFLLLLLGACKTDVKKNEHSGHISQLDNEINIAIKEFHTYKPEKAKKRLLRISDKALQAKDWNANMHANYELGIVCYSLSEIDNAIKHWKISSKMALLAKDPLTVASSSTNIGTAYMQKGYAKSAILYFNKARTTYETLNIYNENYWINTINIGVSYIELKDFAKARFILNRAKKSKSNIVMYFYYVNMAKLEALENNKLAFLKHLEQAKKYVKHVPFQENMLHEVDLEYSIRFNDINKIREIIERPFWKKQTLNFYQKTILNYGSIIVSNKPYEDFQKLKESVDIQAVNKKDVKLYYEMMAIYFTRNSDYKTAVEFYRKCKEIDEEIEYETSIQILDDYKLVKRSEALILKNKKLNETKKVQDTKIQMISFLLGFAILFGLILILTFILMYRSNKQVIQLKEENMKLLNYQLSQSKEDKFKLEADLQFQQKRNFEIESNIKKIAILKKQLEDFFTSIQQADLGENKTKIRNAKIDFDSFFSNYSELAVLAATNSERHIVMSELLKEKSHLLTDKEIQILALILNNFTTKEIGIIVGKSEKAIEYSRKSIRQKLNIPNELTLPEFLTELIKKQP